eukprot:Skav212238  [mRNA]  locus=scaffold4106:65916:73917:+ [translate_table: standard]
MLRLKRLKFAVTAAPEVPKNLAKSEISWRVTADQCWHQAVRPGPYSLLWVISELRGAVVNLTTDRHERKDLVLAEDMSWADCLNTGALLGSERLVPRVGQATGTATTGELRWSLCSSGALRHFVASDASDDRAANALWQAARATWLGTVTVGVVGGDGYGY